MSIARGAVAATADCSRIHVVLGTKAQMVKMAPVMAELQRRKIAYRFIHTGQHQETMNELRSNFAVKPPDVILHSGSDVVKVGAMIVWAARIASQAVFARRRIFGTKERGGYVLVHGDTMSTLLGAVMGRLAGMTVCHVESGLRSFRLFHPFPEELTRLVVFRLSQIYFCPGPWAMANLKGYSGRKVDTCGNTLFDSLRTIIARPPNRPKTGFDDNYCVCSVHRFENVFNREAATLIVELVEKVAALTPVVFILHPPTRRQLTEFGLLQRLEDNPRIETHPRYDYHQFISLVHDSRFLLTDGGSNQEEASYMGKPCLLLRRATERREGLGENCVLSGLDEATVLEFCRDYRRFERPLRTGEESPSAIIVDTLTDG